MPTTKPNAKPKAPKRPADYAKLAGETELIRDGLSARVAKIDQHVAELLADVPHREAIMQSVNRRQNWAAQLYEVEARLARYVGLRDRSADSEPPADS